MGNVRVWGVVCPWGIGWYCKAFWPLLAWLVLDHWYFSNRQQIVLSIFYYNSLNRWIDLSVLDLHFIRAGVVGSKLLGDRKSLVNQIKLAEGKAAVTAQKRWSLWKWACLLPRASVELVSCLVVEATGERVEDLGMLPDNQIPPILSNNVGNKERIWKIDYLKVRMTTINSQSFVRSQGRWQNENPKVLRTMDRLTGVDTRVSKNKIQLQFLQIYFTWNEIWIRQGP